MTSKLHRGAEAGLLQIREGSGLVFANLHEPGDKRVVPEAVPEGRPRAERFIDNNGGRASQRGQRGAQKGQRTARRPLPVPERHDRGHPQLGHRAHALEVPRFRRVCNSYQTRKDQPGPGRLHRLPGHSALALQNAVRQPPVDDQDYSARNFGEIGKGRHNKILFFSLQC